MRQALTFIEIDGRMMNGDDIVDEASTLGEYLIKNHLNELIVSKSIMPPRFRDLLLRMEVMGLIRFDKNALNGQN